MQLLLRRRGAATAQKCDNSLKAGIKRFVIRGRCGVMVQFGPDLICNLKVVGSNPCL